ncbi:intraflagellar transport protein 27 homolog isoform X1 [Corythoichthys intestinalis]|uniref:intraflagellar transport protein 27 homolog isoform X1 n=1 Tax=Corythoichthys intestinalis TaxID=161448 RepID=UPI0025A56DD5|nr:intraflagellar transport protein 27 homolog isoform X1 [Corythoichthys intestinalis]
MGLSSRRTTAWNPENAHAGTGRTCNFPTGRLELGLNPLSQNCEVDVLTTVSTCRLHNTTGVELLIKSVNIPESSDSVELYIIDSAGKESLVEAIEKMWGEPSLVCLVFDLTSERSFGNCSRWMDRVRAHCRGLQVPGVLVGNKCDLSARREVQTTIAQEWAQSEGLEYHETSAKEMENSEVPLLSLARAFHSLYQERRETIQNLRQA